MHIKRSDDVPAFASQHGEVVHELIGNKAGGSSAHSMAQITLPAGKASRKHYHPVAEESYYILAGRGSVLIDDVVKSVGGGDAIMIPPNAIHQIRNDSPTNENLVFIAVCIPAWTPDNSVFLD